jgi:plastocyanin
MRRAAICGAIAVALAAAAVAVGAGTDVRIHRLHVPPPPVGDDTGTSVPPAPGKPDPTNPTDPSVPGTSPPAAPPPPGAQPPPPPSTPPSGVACGTDNVATANINATLSDNSIALAPASSVAAAPTLRFRATYPAGMSLHNLSLRAPSGPLLCGTTMFGVGGAETLIVTNLPPGTYQLYCTIHVDFGMTTPFTVTN